MAGNFIPNRLQILRSMPFFIRKISFQPLAQFFPIWEKYSGCTPFNHRAKELFVDYFRKGEIRRKDEKCFIKWKLSHPGR
jgi:hypothetical protein